MVDPCALSDSVECAVAVDATEVIASPRPTPQSVSTACCVEHGTGRATGIGAPSTPVRAPTERAGALARARAAFMRLLVGSSPNAAAAATILEVARRSRAGGCEGIHAVVAPLAPAATDVCSDAMVLSSRAAAIPEVVGIEALAERATAVLAGVADAADRCILVGSAAVASSRGKAEKLADATAMVPEEEKEASAEQKKTNVRFQPRAAPRLADVVVPETQSMVPTPCVSSGADATAPALALAPALNRNVANAEDSYDTTNTISASMEPVAMADVTSPVASTPDVEGTLDLEVAVALAAPPASPKPGSSAPASGLTCVAEPRIVVVTDHASAVDAGINAPASALATVIEGAHAVDASAFALEVEAAVDPEHISTAEAIAVDVGSATTMSHSSDAEPLASPRKETAMEAPALASAPDVHGVFATDDDAVPKSTADVDTTFVDCGLAANAMASAERDIVTPNFVPTSATHAQTETVKEHALAIDAGVSATTSTTREPTSTANVMATVQHETAPAHGILLARDVSNTLAPEAKMTPDTSSASGDPDTEVEAMDPSAMELTTTDPAVSTVIEPVPISGAIASAEQAAATPSRPHATSPEGDAGAAAIACTNVTERALVADIIGPVGQDASGPALARELAPEVNIAVVAAPADAPAFAHQEESADVSGSSTAAIASATGVDGLIPPVHSAAAESRVSAKVAIVHEPVADTSMALGTSTPGAKERPPKRRRLGALETPDPAEPPIRRSMRQRVQPLEHWRNERVEYERKPGSVLPTIASVHRVSMVGSIATMSMLDMAPNALEKLPIKHVAPKAGALREMASALKEGRSNARASEQQVDLHAEKRTMVKVKRNVGLDDRPAKKSPSSLMPPESKAMPKAKRRAMLKVKGSLDLDGRPAQKAPSSSMSAGSKAMPKAPRANAEREVKKSEREAKKFAREPKKHVVNTPEDKSDVGCTQKKPACVSVQGGANGREKDSRRLRKELSDVAETTRCAASAEQARNGTGRKRARQEQRLLTANARTSVESGLLVSPPLAGAGTNRGQAVHCTTQQIGCSVPVPVVSAAGRKRARPEQRGMASTNAPAFTDLGAADSSQLLDLQPDAPQIGSQPPDPPQRVAKRAASTGARVAKAKATCIPPSKDLSSRTRWVSPKKKEMHGTAGRLKHSERAAAHEVVIPPPAPLWTPPPLRLPRARKGAPEVGQPAVAMTPRQEHAVPRCQFMGSALGAAGGLQSLGAAFESSFMQTQARPLLSKHSAQAWRNA